MQQRPNFSGATRRSSFVSRWNSSLQRALPRRWQPVAWLIAAVVAIARVYAGVHLPLDVVGGAGLGLLLGTFSRWAFGLGGEGLPVEGSEIGLP